MAEQSYLEKIGATPGKIAVTAVLAGVFVSLLIMQLGNDSSPISPAVPRQGSTSTKAAISPRQPRRPPSAARPAVVAPQVVKDRPWPQISLEEVRKYDPFAMPAVLRDPGGGPGDDAGLKQLAIQQRAEARRQALAALREKGVGVVLRSGDELVAIIGSDTVRIGDVIDGFKVVAIGPDGVMLEPDKPQ